MSEDRLYHALVVDDQENWQRALRDLLETDLGFRVSVAKNLEEAKKKLQTSEFDLAVLDVRLKDEQVYNVEGIALLKYIKSDFPTIRTIVITGYPKSIPENNRDILTLKFPEALNFDEVFKNRVREFFKELQ